MKTNLNVLLLILLVSFFQSFGQHINFEKNINISANELTQYLNENKDSLFLKTKKSLINKVYIFNDEFSKTIGVQNTSTKINLNDLPFGNFIIEAQIRNKLVIMYLQKIDDGSNTALELSRTHKISSSISVKDYFSGERNIECEYFWVVSESISNFASVKTMKLESKSSIKKLITRHKSELKSYTGKNNKLLIYAIHDKSEFMNRQFRNPEYYKSVESSEYFNTDPIIISDIQPEFEVTFPIETL